MERENLHKESVSDCIIEFVKNHNSVGDNEIKGNTSLITEGLVDSNTIIQLITYIEDKYNVSFTEDDLLSEDIVTPFGLEKIIREKEAEK